MHLKKRIIIGSLLASGMLVQATTLITGTPRNGASASSTSPTPSFGTLYNFDSLTPNSTFAPATYAAQGVNISSPDGLVVLPFSTQSGPNELFDNSANGTADITIKVSTATDEIGIGIADADGVPITLQALTLTGADLGSAFTVNIPSNTVNPFNGYYVITDTSNDIGGLQILQSTGNVNFSGLAIDDLQVAPEPASFALGVAGVVVFGALRRRRRAQ